MSDRHTRQDSSLGLHGRTVVITRPAGTGSAVARQVRRLGGLPVLLPGLSLRGIDDAPTRAALVAAMHEDVAIFTSPAAVRFAARLQVLRGSRALVLAVGQGTARALRRQGIQSVLAPLERQNSEGVLELPIWRELGACRIALIGAPGGRGVLREQLAQRGSLREVLVYRRVPPRLRAGHWHALQDLPTGAAVLFSSAEALTNLRSLAAPPAWQRLVEAMAVVSSERLAEVAMAAGFSRVLVAASANTLDLLAAVVQRPSPQEAWGEPR
ncbi:MAG TPA: uroporphyrinogen-III synthase [Dyella sp.]|uniref:uroporphyrinogen-III synthase n=1 Tax=Dyella sp. TaxID=1869338 RepID=UPI002F9257A4